MTGQFLRPDLDAPALRAAWPEICQALDSLRERLSRLVWGGYQGASSASPPGDADPPALAIVQEILSMPSSSLHPSELFTLAMDRLSRLLAADRAMLFVAEAGGARLVPRSAHGFRRDDLESIALQPGEGLVGRAFKERRVLTYSSGSEAEAADSFIQRFPVWAAIAVPVRGEDEVTGVLYAGRRRLGAPFGANDVVLLLVIADRVGGGLVHQALLDRRTRHVARLGELAAFAGRVAAAPSLNDVLAKACEAGCRLVEVPAAAIAVAGRGDELELVAARGLPAAQEAWRRVDLREGLTAEIYTRGGAVACRDVQSRPAPERSFLGDGGFHGCLLLPLPLGNEVAGVLYLADTEVRDFSAEEIQAAGVLAAMASMAVDNSRSRGELRGALEGARTSQERLVHVEKARALAEMAGGLARELDNIFAIILGKSRLLLTHTHDESLRDGLGLLEEAAWRGADVVHRLAALGAPTSGEPAPVDLTAIVQDALALTRPRWKDDNEGRKAPIDIVTDLRSVPAVLIGAEAIREAVVNLIVNAVDAMPQGGRLTVATRPRAAGVEVVVEDTGEGISEDVRSRVFDPFFTTRGPGHMGLGLTVAHGVVTRSSGRVEVASGTGGGTRVVMWLPAMHTAAAPPAPGAAGASATGEREAGVDHGVGRPPGAGIAAPPGPTAGVLDTQRRQPTEPERRVDPGAEAPSQPASILVLEDEAPIRSLLVEALTQAGYRVDTAVDGLSGLAQLEGGQFDVVLTDLALPQRSGLDIARAVKRLSPRTPVVLITGWGHLLVPERLREHGVDLMLVKPFRLERVLSVVADALRLRRSA
jgi:signal transduction histidine kinase